MAFWNTIDKIIERIDFKHIIGLCVVGFIFHLFYLTMFNQLPEDADQYAAQIITALTSTLTMVLGYWFISSAGKKDPPDLPPGTQGTTSITTSTTVSSTEPEPES